MLEDGGDSGRAIVGLDDIQSVVDQFFGHQPGGFPVVLDQEDLPAVIRHEKITS